MKMRKRLLSLLLVVLMVFTMLPTGVMAEGVREAEPTASAEVAQQTEEAEATPPQAEEEEPPADTEEPAQEAAEAPAEAATSEPSAEPESEEPAETPAEGEEPAEEQEDNAEAELVAKIDALPGVDEVSALLAEVNGENPDAEKVAQAQALQTEVLALVSEWEALSEEQKASVTNLPKLLGLMELFSSPIVVLADRDNMQELLDGDYAYINDEGLIDDSTTESGYSIRTGTGPWDENDEAGNDSSELNNTIRTFDIASYDFQFTTRVRKDAPAINYKNGNLYFEFVLPGTSAEIQFEPSSMGWLAAKDATYTITEEQVNGKTSQVMRGVVLLTPNGENPQAIGEAVQSLNIYFRVLGMRNGDQVAPTMTLWLEGNDIGKDYTGWGTAAYTGGAVTGNTADCNTHSSTEHVTIQAPPIKVSAAPRYNVEIKPGPVSRNSALGDFDFSTGNELAENKDRGIRNGRVWGYGLALSIQGKSAAHGLRGVELPNGTVDATFDLDLSNQFTLEKATSTYPNRVISFTEGSDFSLLLWGGSENNDYSNRPSLKNGRNLNCYINYAERVPFNKATGTYGCADGGTWSFRQEGNTLHVTVNGAVFDPNKLPFRSAYSNWNDYQYYNPNNISGYWDVEHAYFSAGQLWLLQPFYDADGTYICNVEGSGNGVFNNTVQDRDLAISISDGTNLNPVTQAITTDDYASVGVELLKPGSINSDSQYNATSRPALFAGFLTPEGNATGQDYIVQGGELVTWGYVSSSGPEGEYRYLAYDIMVKFDDAFFAPSRALMQNGHRVGIGETLLWGGKIGGWNHNGLAPDQPGYDAEMIAATPDDLTFFTSLEELLAAGYTPVAAMAEKRLLSPETAGGGTGVSVFGSCKDTAIPGQVYMITQYARAWNVRDLAKASGKSSSELLSMTDEELAELMQEYIPSKASNTPYSEYKLAATWEDHPTSYEKPFYNENGYNSRTEGWTLGDACLVLGHKVNTLIKVAQTTPDNSEKLAFDMDAAQRIVDYVVTPSISRQNGGDNTTSYKTTVTQTIQLPAELHYIEGSMYLGGSYVMAGEGKRGTVTDGTQLPENGVTSFTDSKGNVIPVRFEVTSGENGTTFTITMEDVEVTGEAVQYLEQLHFSAVIGTPGREDSDVKNNDHIAVTTEIYSSHDNNRARNIANGNAALSDIQVSKLNASNLSKFADQNVVELTEPMGFTMNVGNNTDKAIAVTAIDGLPYNGDGFTRYNGEMYVTEFSVLNPDKVDLSKFSFYYTTDENERGHDSNYYQRQMTDFATDSNWTELTLDESAKAAVPGGFQPVAIAAIGMLDGGKVLKMHVTLSLPDAHAGDRVENRLTKDNLSASATSRIVQRSIEGLTWLDSNYNGLQDEGEERINGVKVTLQKWNETTQQYEDVVSIQTGEKIDVIRNGSAQPYDYSAKDKDNVGRYRFDNLLPGTYRVVFESGNGFTMDYYRASPVDAGDDTKDSDGVPTSADGKLQKTEIDEIVMLPAKELTLGSQNIAHLDSGFDILRTNFTAHKSWNDQEDKFEQRPDSITVQLYADGEPVQGKTAELNASNNWSFTFENLPKLNPDTHEEIVYTVQEVGDVPGYTTDNGTPENGEQTVTNEMNKTESGSASFQIKKVREGDDSVVVPGAVFTLSDGTTATTDANGIATFSFTFGEEETKAELTLTETSAPAGYTKSDESWTVSFTRDAEPTVTLNQSKNLFEIVWGWIIGVKDDSSYENGVLTVSNPYSAEDDLTLTGSKTLTGRTMADDEFTFTVTENGKTVSTGKSKADGSIVFEPIHYTYKDAGTHTYTITENAGKLGGVTYDKQSFTVTVTVVDNKDGTLTVTPTYPEGGVAFANSYAATGKTALEATKTLTGRELQANEFSFTVREGDKTVATGKNDKNGKIVFSEINYTLDDVGTHTYTITEDKGTLGGVTYDAKSLTVTVNVTDNGDGTLKVETSYPAAMSFDNSYAAEGKAALEATKTLTGRELKAEEFSFTLKEGETVIETVKNAADGKISFSEINYTLDDVGEHTYTITEVKGTLGGVTYDTNSIQVTVKVTDNGDGTLKTEVSYPKSGAEFKNTYEATGKVALEATKTLTGRKLKAEEFSFTLKEGETVIETVKNAADGKISFSEINYTLDDVGTHTYTITEDAGSLGGVTYDTKTLTVTVNVTDNGDGTLKVETSYPESVAFENRYAATGEVTLEAEKSLNGRELKAEEFSFTVKEGETVVGTAKNGADGKITFPTISYTLDDVGSHTYTITEDEGTLGGVTYSTESYTVTVTVSDNGDGTLKVEVLKPDTGVIFNNTYKAVGKIALEAEKTLTGRALNDGEFTFTVSEDGKSVATGSNDENGKIVFSEINYTLDDVGTHTYTIAEDTGALGGVSYSEQTFPVTVEVTDNGDGTLKAVASYPEDGTTFENTYEAEGTVALESSKTLTGRELKAEEFSFTLKEGETVIETVKNDENGKSSFTEINYTLDDVGEHTYTVTEDKGELGGVTYDEQSFEIKVTVTDNGDGTLKVETEYPEGGVKFENKYDTEPITLTLEGKKELTGRDMAEGEFSFTVKEGDEVVATGKNDKDGKIVFTDITYKLEDVGTHSLVITEDTGDKGGVEYSKESYTVTVTVSDNGDGTLKVEAVLPEGGLTFHNGYTAAEAVVTLGAKKNYTGATLKDSQFSFELKDADGKVVETVKNKADGSIVFTELHFTEAGTYTYTISEVDGKAARVTYDKTVYTVTITVTDDGEGKLVAKVDTADKTLVFNNKYTPTTPESNSPKTGDSSNVTLWATMMLLSTSALAVLLGKKKRYAGKHCK